MGSYFLGFSKFQNLGSAGPKSPKFSACGGPGSYCFEFLSDFCHRGLIVLNFPPDFGHRGLILGEVNINRTVAYRSDGTVFQYYQSVFVLFRRSDEDTGKMKVGNSLKRQKTNAKQVLTIQNTIFLPIAASRITMNNQKKDLAI